MGSPMAKGSTVTTTFPYAGLPQIPTQSKNSDNELKRIMLHTEIARMLSFSYPTLLFLPCGHVLPWEWVVLRVVRGNLTY